ncbi:MAG: hypothetical protein ACTSP6_06085 [Promethearchaeota archaeon]
MKGNLKIWDTKPNYKLTINLNFKKTDPIDQEDQDTAKLMVCIHKFMNEIGDLIK